MHGSLCASFSGRFDQLFTDKIKFDFNQTSTSMKQLLSIATLLLLFSVTAFGQIEATTKEGKKVILNPDGTWKYDETIKESKTSFECDDLIANSTDKVTGKTTRGSKESLLVSKDGKNGFGFYLFEGSNSIILSATVVGAGGCIDDTNKMNILFRDGSRLELVNNGKFNCESNFTLYFGGVFGKKKELEQLRTKEIETMRIWTSKSYVEEDFAPEQSKAFMKSLDCLATK